MSDTAQSKRERLFALAKSEFKLKMTASGRPVATAGNLTYPLASRNRDGMRSALRLLWRDRCADDPPGDQIVNAVVADLHELALKREPEPPTPQEETRELIMEAGPTPALSEHPGRLEVSAGNRNPFDIAREVADFIRKANDPPVLFSMGPAAVRLKDDGTLASLDQDGGAGWLAFVAERIDFVIHAKDVQRLVAPPGAAMKILPAIVIPELPPLDGVVTTPYLDADGDVVAADGYHAGTRLVLLTRGLVLPPVSTAPSDQEVAAAVDLLTGEWLTDFPWAEPADMVNAIAGLLTVTGRHFFPLAPLFVIDASTPGSGKGLLVATLIIIVTGNAPAFMELPTDGEEQRKKITAAMLSGQTLITWDESHVITGRSLAMTLTAETYSDRILGGNKLMSVRNRTTQFSLGNNVQVWGDMKRRVLPARLVPDTEHPEHRTRFRHANLELWVRQNRGNLLAAALTIWRNWDAKGRPKATASMGSFERWAQCVGGALEAAGLPGFLSHTAQWLDSADDDAPEWAEHLAALRNKFEDTKFTALDVALLAGRQEIDLPWFKRDPDAPLYKALGYRYRAIRDRWLGDHRLVQDGVSHGRTRWTVAVREVPKP